MKLTFPLFPQYFKASTGDGRRWEADKNRSQYGGERWGGENNKKSSFLPLLFKEVKSPLPFLLCCERSYYDNSFLPPLVKEDDKDIDDSVESISFMRPKICKSCKFPLKVVKFINACHCTGQVEAWLNLLMFSMRETIR